MKPGKYYLVKHTGMYGTIHKIYCISVTETCYEVGNNPRDSSSEFILKSEFIPTDRFEIPKRIILEELS